MAQNRKPRWLNTRKLMTEAGESLQKKIETEKTAPKLKIAQFKQVSAFSCPNCRLKFTSGQIESQIRKAAREGNSYIECPQCGATLKEDRFAQVKDPEPIIHRAQYLNDANRRPNIGRVPNMWVDKAIYGRLVQKLAEYVAKVGITNPQMKFQRGIRSSKFPGEPHSAKGAEFSVEFIDRNNTRNRIFIQAGLTAKGDFIYPRTFKTTIGQEYPLTTEAIVNFTSGKLFNPVTPSMQIPPLTYRQPDYTRFREISADQQKMQKTAQADPNDPNAVDDNNLQMHVQEMGITDPTDQETIKNIMRKYVDVNNPEAFAPGMSTAQTGENFTQGLGLGIANKLNLHKIGKVVKAMQDNYTQVVLNALNDGLSYDEAVQDVYSKTGMPLNEKIWAAAMNYLIQQEDQSPVAVEAALAKQLVAQAEESMFKKFQKTAEDVKEEFDFSNLTADETNTFVDTFVTTYNNALQSGEGIVNAQHQAHYTAGSQLQENRIKKALRDEQTLVPYTDPDPDYSLAEQTVQSEPRFDKPGGEPLKYNETDGGISNPEDRNITHMFGRDKQASVKFSDVHLRQKGTEEEVVDDKGKDNEVAEQYAAQVVWSKMPESEKKSSIQKSAYIRHENGQWVVHSESGKILGKHKTKREAEKQLQAIHIHQHGSVKKTNPDENYSKTAAYQITNVGQQAVDRLRQGFPVGDFDPQTLLSILIYLEQNPYATTETLQELATMAGINTNVLRDTFARALEQGLLTITPEENVEEFYTQYSFKDGIEKKGEATGVDLEPDQVGQNPINYSRYKEMVQDLIRAGNIPPTKVDLHALKDNKYSLQELKDLVQTFKVDSDAVMYPTQHASVDTIKKLAEKKLSDILKEMPMEKVEGDEKVEEEVQKQENEKKSLENPGSAEGKDEGAEEPLSEDDIKLIHEEMSEDTPESDTIKGGLGDDIPSAAFDVEQLVRGIKVEFEHTNDIEKAEEIAKDHLMEDPAYYIKLHEMENISPLRNAEELHKALTEKTFSTRKRANQILRKLYANETHLCSWCKSLYDPTTGEKVQLTDEEYAETQKPESGASHGICPECAAEQAHKVEEYRARRRNQMATTKKAQDEESLPPGTLYGPRGEIISKPEQEKSEEGSALRLEPPKFLSRKAPNVEETEAVEGTPEEARFVQQLTEGKAKIDQIQNKITEMQRELQTRIAPLQKELGTEGQGQMRATRALTTLMRQLNHTLIQVDNQVAQYIEVPASRSKLTSAEKVEILLDKFGEAALRAITEAEDNLNQIEQVVGRYKQWPKKTSADINADDQFIAALYQETYNTLADFLDVTNELNLALAM